jgi:hypothetical protein
MNKHSIADLQELYTDGENADQELFSEMRSNVLLYSGDHYARKNSRFFNRIRDSKDLAQEQKLRLTKNHIQYICDTYVNNIVAPNPGVGFTPKNEKEVHDQKVAELHHAVWRDAHDRYNFDDKVDDWADSFVQIGEVCVKIYFDPDRGPVKAYPQKADEDGNPLFLGPDGEETADDGTAYGMQFSPAPDKDNPVRTGEFVFEEVYGFNLLRPSECKDMRTAAWLGIRKMAYTKDLIKKFPESAEDIKEGKDDTYNVFDISKGGYVRAQGQTMVVEYYFRPCADYPNGYFYITTRETILAEGELPGGIFPIAFQAFRKFPTTPRGRSPIKTMRPYQAEINRSASKIAEHQITLGDDKLLIQNGTKISQGVALPGVRSINYTGIDPKILEGRDGSQYLAYMNSQITEMYQVMGVKEDNDELPAQLDPHTMLFRAARQKKKFQRYIKRIEKFLIDVVTIYLKLAKLHLPDDSVIYAVGSTEAINLEEFRSAQDICYEIKIESQSEDVESKLGKQIAINQALQYVGAKMKSEDIGKLLRQMPYGNFDESFGDLTIDYDTAVNDILALDRGEMPPVNQYDPHPYMIKKLVYRTRLGDFKTLDPRIQQNYRAKIKLHQEFEARNQLAIQRAQQGLIPTGGYMVKCDLYVPGATPDAAPKRLSIPSETLQWVVKQVEAQQTALAPVLDMGTGVQAEMANTFSSMQGTGPGTSFSRPSPQEAMNRSAMFPATA